MKDKELASIFENCYPNTLDTTINNFTANDNGIPDTFVVTGGILIVAFELVALLEAIGWRAL